MTAFEAAELDLRSIVRPGDHIVGSQGAGEAQTLTEALVRQRAELGGVGVFLGSTFSETLRAEHADHLAFTAIGGIGRNAALFRGGVLDVLPCHVSSVPQLIRDGTIPVDVAFVQLSAAGPDGRHSLGLVADYIREAMAQARTVVAEINDQLPYVLGDTLVEPGAFEHAIHTSRRPVTLPVRAPTDAESAIGERVASLVPERAVLALGIGGVSAAVAHSLVTRRDLSVHGGVVSDWIIDLVEAGAVTNAHKPIDVGVSVAGHAYGSQRLYDFLDHNPAVGLFPISHTHSPKALARLDRFFAVNGALEVDLTGQVNAETVGGVHVGAVAGQVDFVRAAMRSRGGISVIALASTARGGSVSRIVTRLADGVVTTPRSDADVVATEHGAAFLRGVPVRERARRLAAIAAPAFRAELLAAASAVV